MATSSVAQQQTWVCSGDGPGTHEQCDYRASSADEAFEHFETTGHCMAQYQRLADWITYGARVS